MRHQQDRHKRGTFLLFALAVVLLVTGCTSDFNALNSVTDRGDKIAWLTNLSFILSFIVMGMVFVLLIFALIRFRSGAPSTREGNTRLEIIWTALPALLLIVLFVFTVRTVINTSDNHAEGADVLHVTITGKQWWWNVEYPDLGITTANVLHLPVDRPVAITLQSTDVIHSLWIPEIGWKLDNIPGKTNVLNFTLHQTGEFDGACAEFCGVQHAWMRIKLYAQPGDAFSTWANAAAGNAIPPDSQILQNGKSVFLTQSCASCHTIKGVSEVTNVGPDLTHFASREFIGGGVVDNNDANLEAWLRDPSAIKPGVLMPGFNNLPDEEIKALLAYLRSLK